MPLADIQEEDAAHAFTPYVDGEYCEVTHFAYLACVVIKSSVYSPGLGKSSVGVGVRSLSWRIQRQCCILAAIVGSTTV